MAPHTLWTRALARVDRRSQLLRDLAGTPLEPRAAGLLVEAVRTSNALAHLAGIAGPFARARYSR